MPSTWTRTRAAVNPLAKRLGFYTAYPLSAGERIATIDTSAREARARLVQQG